MKKAPDASDEATVKRLEQKDRDLRETELEDLKKLLGVSYGRRLAWRVLEKAGVHRTSFTGNSTTYFNEGARNIGCWFLSEIMEADLDAYVIMLKENRTVE
tara:strand:- start:665 stop:967 length:303 start_codon:yes stop_codon:yes gene_type:complete